MKHTPGPWEFRKEGDWTVFANGSSIMGNAAYYPWVPYDEADWHLIAAAPELLEAAQKALRIAELWIYDQLEGTSMFKEAYEELSSVRAAIAKATGEQQ